MTTTIFSPQHYEGTRRPLHQASPLPGWCYVSPEWYERELETIFRKDWLCVGRVEQIPKPGDFFSVEMIGQPLIVVRDEAAHIRVHSAVCRHRAAVITESAGHCRAFVCPYHNWTYSLSGKLVSTPGEPHPMAGAEGFACADFGLSAVRAETWAGFIFINLDEKARPLLSWLGDLPEFLAEYELDSMQWQHRDTYEVGCNWKVWLENALEPYHANFVHRKHMVPGKPQSWVYEKTRGPWEAKFSKESLVAYTGLPTLSTVSAQKAAGLFHLWVQPSVQIILTSTYMKFRQYLPEGPEKLRLHENWTFPRQTVESPQFGNLVDQPYYRKFAEIIQEDVAINHKVQKGLRSGAYRPGRYSLDEYILHRLANRVLDRVIGPDDQRTRDMREGVGAFATDAV